MPKSFLRHPCASLIALAVASPAWSQTPATGAGAADVPASSATAVPNGSNDIVVTARRRLERLQDVPVAATAFGTRDLARYSTQSFAHVASQTPALVIGSTANTGGGVINLRGIGSPSAGPSIDQAVSINVDGIQFSQANVLKLGLYDLNRIEVLKGPQALFYGKNSAGGVISLISADPGKNFEGRVRTGYEFANEQKYVEGMISGPLTDTLGARITAYFSDQDGWFRNDAKPIPAAVVPASLGGTGESTQPGPGSSRRTGPANRDIFVRGTLAYAAPSGIVDATLKASYSDLDRKNGFGQYAQLIDCVGSAPQYVLALGTTGSRDCKLNRAFNEPDVSPAIQALNPKLPSKQYFKNDQKLISLTANFHPTDQLTITSVTGYYNLSERLTGSTSFGDLDFVQLVAHTSLKQFSQEARVLTSFDSPLNFMAGAYYQHVDNRSKNLIPFDAPLSRIFTGGRFTGPVLVTNNILELDTDAYSFFGQAILDVTSKVQATAGGRLSRETKSAKGISLPTAYSADTFEVPITPNKRKFKDFSPEITLSYKPLTTLNLYAAYREGFTSGSFDLNSGAIGFGRRALGNISFDQQTAKGGEVGVKGSLADRQISFDIAAFRYKYEGLQVSAFDALTLGYRITNAGSAIVQGVEFASQYRPDQLPGLTLRAAVAYNDSHYDTFTNAPCYTGQTPADRCRFVAGVVGGQLSVVPAAPGQTANAQDLSGRPLTRSSRWSGSVGGTYEHRLDNDFTLALSTDANYTSAYYAQPEQDIRSRQRRTWRLNANFTVRAPDDRWELALIGTNLTNTLRAAVANASVGTGGRTGTATGFKGDLIGTPTEPRTVAVQGTVRF